jgi:hypothetical protein
MILSGFRFLSGFETLVRIIVLTSITLKMMYIFRTYNNFLVDPI